jgi:hypothetical protein
MAACRCGNWIPWETREIPFTSYREGLGIYEWCGKYYEQFGYCEYAKKPIPYETLEGAYFDYGCPFNDGHDDDDDDDWYYE